MSIRVLVRPLGMLFAVTVLLGGVDMDKTVAKTPASGPAPAGSERPAVPKIIGDWWRIAAPPKLEKYDKAGIEAVDFTIFQAADGTWQLISCLRNTAHPGAGRLLFRWEAKNLTDRDWTPQGIFWTTKPELGQVEGRLQAPHCVLENGRYYLFHNSNGAFCLVSEDGKNFRQHRSVEGQARFFDMGRDVMIFDNRPRDGRWYAFYTDIVPDKYQGRKGHTVSFRTAQDLNGPWSKEKTDTGVVTADKPGDPYNFINAESPFVLYRDGWYYRLEQMNVLASKNVADWNVPILTTLGGKDPWGFIAPEVVVQEGQYFVVGYKYSRKYHGLYMARMQWPEPTSKPAQE